MNQAQKKPSINEIGQMKEGTEQSGMNSRASKACLNAQIPFTLL